jgi:protein involved in polysaccharide export with SLBB domain
MRNHSSARSSFRRALLFWIVGAAVLVLCAPRLRAQCSAGDDPDSFGCPMQQPSVSSSTTYSGQSQGMPIMHSQAQQGISGADLSMAASADNGLSSGPIYNEQAWRNGPNAAGAQARNMPALPPEPPTEFQRFVATTVGRMLPIYGARIFQAQEASFGPIDQAPAPENMVIGAGDELRIRIWGQINFSANLLVSREGEIYLPKVGAVHVAGLEFSSVASHLRQALERVYRNFDLSVDMGEIHSIQVYVAGQARHPGEYTVSALSTLVDAVFQSGGPSRSGSMRHVELKRAGKVITDFDLYALLVKGDKTGDVQLQPGDVLFIPAAGPEVAIVGSVRQPAIYELRGQESIQQLLDAAGGRTAVASGGSISLERIVNHAQLRAFNLKDDAAGLAAPLADGDIVRINPIVSSYRETVTLRGSVATPGRFLWHAGMRLSDLMPDRDSLVSRNYWWRRTQLGLPAPEFAPQTETNDSSSQSADSFPMQQADRFPRRQNRTDSAQQSGSESMQQADNFANRYSGVLSQQPAPGSDSSAAMQKAHKSRSTESAGALGSIEVNLPGETAAALLHPEFETDWNYAVIQRLNPDTMTTSLIPFDLGKLVLSHDASQDLELQPGDIVTVFSQDDIPQPLDRQTKYVRLEGEFVHAGVYSVQPGETLRSLVARAGGLTSKAYLYGAEFTRKSTEAIEQRRLNEYAAQLEHQLLRGSITMANSGSGTQQEAQPGQVASFNRELIDQLHQLQPTGRIVLDFNPHSRGGNELPETALEDGDQLLVPPTPATIQVIGAVHNQNAFLYRDGARVGEYLHHAGGANRDADRGQVFILRADGSVTSHSQGQSIFSSSSFQNVRLYPGDTIVVPEKNIGPGNMRQFLNWTQLFSQLGLGAATIGLLM